MPWMALTVGGAPLRMYQIVASGIGTVAPSGLEVIAMKVIMPSEIDLVGDRLVGRLVPIDGVGDRVHALAQVTPRVLSERELLGHIFSSLTSCLLDLGQDVSLFASVSESSSRNSLPRTSELLQTLQTVRIIALREKRTEGRNKLRNVLVTLLDALMELRTGENQ
jgi:hypothetical protein